MIKVRIAMSLWILILVLIMIKEANGSEQIPGKKVLFIHHSTGGNLLEEGEVRERLNKLNPSIQLWDHNYNLSPLFTTFLAKRTHLRGLTDNKGVITGTDYDITISNNSPKEYAELFQRDKNDPTLKAILSYDVTAFKNCYPTTRITSEKQLEEDMRYYKAIRDAIKLYPNKKFVFLTPPPARKSTTNFENAKRAKRLVFWLQSDEFKQSTPHIYIFDLFGLLSDNNGYLKKEYERFLPWDSHPNRIANKTIAPLFAEYLVHVAEK